MSAPQRFLIGRRSVVLGWLLAVLVAVPMATVAQGTGTVVGRVTDARTELPVVGATVQVAGGPLGALTGADGRYRIATVPAGNATVAVQNIGFANARQEVLVTANAQVVADFGLQVAAIALDRIVVTGVAGGERMRAVPNSVSKV